MPDMCILATKNESQEDYQRLCNFMPVTVVYDQPTDINEFNWYKMYTIIIIDDYMQLTRTSEFVTFVFTKHAHHN